MDDEKVRRMRSKSGTIVSSDPVVIFLYELSRDHVPTGVIDELIDHQAYGQPVVFTNGWLAQWAEDAAERMKIHYTNTRTWIEES